MFFKFTLNIITMFITDNDTTHVIRFDPPPTYDEIMTSNNQFEFENESPRSQTLSSVNKQEVKFRSNTKLPTYEEALDM